MAADSLIVVFFPTVWCTTNILLLVGFFFKVVGLCLLTSLWYNTCCLVFQEAHEGIRACNSAVMQQPTDPEEIRQRANNDPEIQVQ